MADMIPKLVPAEAVAGAPNLIAIAE